MRGSVTALLVCGALITTGLGAAAPAAASAVVPPCSVTFEGTVSDQWNTPANWSTGQVPGPHSDVCITRASPAATGKINVHSLQVGAGTSVDFGFGATASVTISDILINHGDISLVNGTLSAPRIDNTFALGGGGSLASPGNATITSPALSSTGLIGAVFGTLRLTDDPLQLHDGTLKAGIFQVIDGTLILHSNISSIVAGQIQLVGGTNPLENQNGANALASLSSIGQNAVLTVVGGSLAVGTNLVNQGFLGVGLNKFGGAMTVGGSFTQTSTGTFRVHFGSELSIGATATLGGSLDMQVNGNCRPQDGAIATAMTFAARNGMFTTHNSGFNVLYGPASVRVQYEGPAGNPCS